MMDLKEPCKSCLGCQRLENPDFTGDDKCKYKMGGTNEQSRNNGGIERKKFFQ